MRRERLILTVGDVLKNHLGRVRTITRIWCEPSGTVRVGYKAERNGKTVHGACDRGNFVSWARSAKKQ